MTEPTITWPELIVLMAFGASSDAATEESVRGTVHVRDVWEIGDSDPAPGDVVEEHPLLGRRAVHETTFRLLRRGRRVRLERPDGSPKMIFGTSTTWLFGTEPPTAFERDTNQFGWHGQELVHRIPPSRWEGSDFTTLTGPIEAVEFLGRAAWAFELAPPSHKPFPLQMTVDAASGLVLRQANRDYGSVTEWLDLELDVDLPDELFAWDGPTQPPEDHRAAREAELAERTGWLESHGLTDLPIPPQLDVYLHEWDDESGSLQLSVHSHGHGTLLRRAKSDEPWAEAESVHYEQSYRWSDDRWDWLYACGSPLDADQLAALKARLALTT